MDTVSTIMARAIRLAQQDGEAVTRPRASHTHLLTCECCGDDVGKLYDVDGVGVCYECTDVMHAKDIEF